MLGKVTPSGVTFDFGGWGVMPRDTGLLAVSTELTSRVMSSYRQCAPARGVAPRPYLPEDDNNRLSGLVMGRPSERGWPIL